MTDLCKLLDAEHEQHQEVGERWRRLMQTITDDPRNQAVLRRCEYDLIAYGSAAVPRIVTADDGSILFEYVDILEAQAEKRHG